jgi:hypothetical protein
MYLKLTTTGRYASLDRAADEWREADWDPSPFAVNADRLLLQGDVRGELAMLQLAGDERRADGLLRKHRKHLLGSMLNWGKEAQLDWAGGYILRAKLSRAALSRGKPHPVEMLEQLLSHESGRYLRWLEVGQCGRHTDYTEVLSVLARHAPLGLTALRLDDTQDALVGNLGVVWKILPRLRRLAVYGRIVGADDTDASELRSLMISSPLDDACLSQLARASWPQLSELNLVMGAATVDAKTLAPLMKNAPKLKSLRILCGNADEVRRALRLT